MKKLLLLLAGGALAHATTAQTLTGYWQGVLLQGSGGAASVYPFLMKLRQNATGQVSGYSEIGIDGTDTFGRLSLTGTLGTGTSPTFTFNELAVVDQTPNSGITWCIKTGPLAYAATARTLTGPWTGRTATSTCSPGTIELYRTALLTDTVFCRSDTKRLEVTGNNVRWYADDQLTALVATGNAYTPVLTASASFYVTQTNRNIESRPMRLNVTVNACTAGTGAAAAAAGLAVYPTQAHEAVTIELTGAARPGSTYALRNVLGEVVAGGALRQQRQAVALAGLRPGLYVLTVYAASGQPLGTGKVFKH